MTFQIKDIFAKVFLLIALIYGFIPFEASFRVDRFHEFWLICMMLYAWYMGSFKFSKYGGSYFFFFLLVFVINALVSIGQDIVIITTSVLFSAVVVPVIYKNERFKNIFISSLRWLIILSITSFLIQFTVYYLTGNLLLMHEFVFPFSEARIAHETTFGNLTRMGGMYIEPGTYANFMFVYLFIYIVLTRNINDKLLYIGSLSIIFTFSVWGAIFSSYLFLMLVMANLVTFSLKKKLMITILILGIGFYSATYLVNNPLVEYAVNKTESGNTGTKGSTAAKKYVYKKYMKEYDEFLLIGEGFKPKFKENTVSMQDSGMLLNMSIVLGKLFTIFFAISFIVGLFRLTNIWIVFASLPIFISKLYYWDPAIYLLYFLVIYSAFFNHRSKV